MNSAETKFEEMTHFEWCLAPADERLMHLARLRRLRRRHYWELQCLATSDPGYVNRALERWDRAWQSFRSRVGEADYKTFIAELAPRRRPTVPGDQD